MLACTVPVCKSTCSSCAQPETCVFCLFTRKRKSLACDTYGGPFRSSSQKFPRNFFISQKFLNYFSINFSLLDNFQIVSQFFLDYFLLLESFSIISQLLLDYFLLLNFLVTLVDEIAVLKINLHMCTQLPWTGVVH